MACSTTYSESLRHLRASPTLSLSGPVNSRWAPFFRTSTSPTVTATPVGGKAHLKCHPKIPAHICLQHSILIRCVWITNRSYFHSIRDSSLPVLEREQAEATAAAAAAAPTPISSSPPSQRLWPGGEKGWASDAGWIVCRAIRSILACDRPLFLEQLLRPPLYIHAQGEVREVFSQHLPPFLTSI